jgi:condensin-2 complex subunit D3
MLETFKVSPVVIQAAITTLSQICESLTRSREGYQAAVDSWCVPLLKKCELYLTSLIEEDNSQSSLPEGGREIDEKEATCYLFAVGELCRLSPAHTSSHLTLMVHSLLLATREGDGEKPSFRSLSSQSSQLSGLTNLSFSPSLRALSYLTLGKLCLQDEELTKQVIPQLVRELQTSPHAATRNNVMVVLCDLAVRYSVKVDPHIPSIAVCLRDESLLVRRQTLTLLASLIQEDYIKWKGALFFRFISTLLDEELRVFAVFCLVHILLARNPNMFFQHFVECVFHFNGYEKHRVYNRFRQTERERELFSLKGSKHRDQRMKLYSFLLSHMTDPHRFQLTAKLCQEVLGGVVDKVILLDESSIPVIRDTLAILTSKEIKLSSLRRNMGEELADEGDHIGAIAAIAQTKIISQIVKKNVIENFIPIVIAAKHLFEKERSPLLRDLLLCLKEMMTDFRSEITEILAVDKQLAEEIEFDLKRVEEEQRRAARAPNTPLPDTPHAQMVSPLLTPGQVCVTPRSVLTPPRLRATPTGNTGKTKGAIVTAKTPRIAALKTPLPRIASPLLTHRTAAPPPSTQPPSSNDVGKVGAVTPLRKPAESSGRQKVSREGGGGDTGRKKRDDVTTPAAARARASLVNTSYVPELMTPLFSKTPQVSLHRVAVAAPLSSRKPLTTPHTHRAEGLRSDETVLQGNVGRVASTPEGLAESISFNVSSVVPPSPIPPTSNPNCYLSRRSDRLRGRTKKATPTTTTTTQTADILMLPPEQEPRKLDKWRIRPK